MFTRAWVCRAAKPAAAGLIAAGFLLLSLFWRSPASSLAAEDWSFRSARQPVPLLTGLAAPKPAVNLELQAWGPHGGYSAQTDQCAACHRGHTAAGRDLTAFWPEEETCFSCHASGGAAAADLLTLFLTFPNTSTAYYSHPVMAISGVHDSPLVDGGEDLFERHAECSDCHDPHTISALEQQAPLASGALAGASGVEPLYAGPGGAVGYTWLDQVQTEYQLCFKCHSGYTVLPGYLPDGWSGSQVVPDGLPKLTNPEPEQVPDSRDLAQEFNPAQASYHPVLAPGRNPLVPAGSFVDGWSSGSYTYCSDCHATRMSSYESDGPHAGQLHILKEASPYVTASGGGRSRLTGSEVCFSCHRSETYLAGGDPVEYTNFRRNTKNLHRTHVNNASCYQCHDSHGSEQRHLLNLDTGLNDQNPELLALLSGYDGLPTNSQSFWQISPDGGTKTCFIACHNQDHTQQGRMYPNYSGE